MLMCVHVYKHLKSEDFINTENLAYKKKCNPKSQIDSNNIRWQEGT